MRDEQHPHEQLKIELTRLSHVPDARSIQLVLESGVSLPADVREYAERMFSNAAERQEQDAMDDAEDEYDAYWSAAEHADDWYDDRGERVKSVFDTDEDADFDDE